MRSWQPQHPADPHIPGGEEREGERRSPLHLHLDLDLDPPLGLGLRVGMVGTQDCHHGSHNCGRTQLIAKHLRTRQRGQATGQTRARTGHNSPAGRGPTPTVASMTDRIAMHSAPTSELRHPLHPPLYPPRRPLHAPSTPFQPPYSGRIKKSTTLCQPMEQTRATMRDDSPTG